MKRYLQWWIWLAVIAGLTCLVLWLVTKAFLWLMGFDPAVAFAACGFVIVSVMAFFVWVVD